MPRVAQNDIFSFADSVDLLIVFGRRGFNEMSVAWGKFRQRFSLVDAVDEPFSSFDARPQEYAPGRYVVTVAEEKNHGMSDDLLREILENYFRWAKENGLRHIATNGIMDTVRSGNNAATRISDDRRASLIITLVSSFERKADLRITLASINDIFVRQILPEIDQGTRSQKVNKDEYINNDDVKEFCLWFAIHLCDSTFKHSYKLRRTRKLREFESLFNAYTQYDWPYPKIDGLAHPPANYDFGANAAVLDLLREKLCHALDPHTGSDSETRDSAIDVMNWGGVRNGNVLWLRNHCNGLRELITKMRDTINLQDIAALPDDLRFNSGMTKVYSLICDDFVIYDSRVAAALGFAVVKFCQVTERATVPKCLAFPWSPAKEDVKQNAPKRRNPSEGDLRFPRLRSGQHHAEWNMKASWLLKKTLECADEKNCFNTVHVPLRALEAALFMVGYDLGSSTPVMQSRVVSSSPDPLSALDTPLADNQWEESETLRRGVHFRYRLLAEGIEVIVTRRQQRVFFPVNVIERTLANLSALFCEKPFPLSNSATLVRRDEAKPGLGCAYFNASGRHGNPPDASFLAAVLDETLGVIIPDETTTRRERSLHWRLNIQLLGSPPDVRTVLQRTLDLQDTN